MKNLIESELGLRSGVSYGKEILRSNLGNEIVRDFTVTGETVNFAARLERFSWHELELHNKQYFANAIERFPEISDLSSVLKTMKNFNPDTKKIIQNYALYQNMMSNLKKLSQVRFDIRCNDNFYQKLKKHLLKKKFETVNLELSKVYGYEEFLVDGYSLKFYFSYFNAKGFDTFEKVWILPLSLNILKNLDIDLLR